MTATVEHGADNARATGPAVKRIEQTLTRGAFVESDVTAAITLLRRTGQRRPPRRQLIALFALAAWDAR